MTRHCYTVSHENLFHVFQNSFKKKREMVIKINQKKYFKKRSHSK